MICSTCNTEVDEYYHGRQCKLCYRKPQKAWWARNREKGNAYAAKWRKDNPKKYRKSLEIARNKNRVLRLIHEKLKNRYYTKHLTDGYIRKVIKKSWGGVPHVITAQEIKDRRKQILEARRIKQAKQEYKERTSKEEYKEPILMVICPIVGREIPTETCHNMQLNYEYKDCQECDHH